MYARVTELVGCATGLDEGDLSYFEADILPSVEALPGMSGGMILVDRDGGRALAIVLYADDETLADSRATADLLRETAFQRMNLCGAPKVHEYEVALAMVREPEPVVI